MSPYVPTGRPRGRPKKGSIDDSLPKGRKYVPTGRPRGRPKKDPLAEGAVAEPRKSSYVPTGRRPGRPRKDQSGAPAAEARNEKLEVEKRSRGRPPAVAKQILQAIKVRRLAAFRYEGKPRIAEIHSYGIMAGRGHEVASGFQTAGYSRKGRLPGWRLFNIERMTEFTLTTRTFNVRPGYTPDDKRFRKLIAKI